MRVGTGSSFNLKTGPPRTPDTIRRSRLWLAAGESMAGRLLRWRSNSEPHRRTMACYEEEGEPPPDPNEDDGVVRRSELYAADLQERRWCFPSADLVTFPFTSRRPLGFHPRSKCPPAWRIRSPGRSRIHVIAGLITVGPVHLIHLAITCFEHVPFRSPYRSSVQRGR